METNALLDWLLDCLSLRVASPVWDQLEALVWNLRNEKTFREVYATAGRRLPSAAVCLTDEEHSRLRQLGITWPVGETLDELGRIWMLISAVSCLTDGTFQTLLSDCYEQGDVRERRAVLRALPFLPEGGRFIPMAVDACRSHIQPVFEAVACENPYPAGHFPEPSFNQMVLKALFTGVALNRVIGLDARITPELTRMAKDYASERRAAGRSVPADLERLIV
ncbi:MAG: EboA domain-containing protein [Nitrospiraceae bacterium]|nr:EboA domain-containing protein [Nitrospiraceae bacterium]